MYELTVGEATFSCVVALEQNDFPEDNSPQGALMQTVAGPVWE